MQKLFKTFIKHQDIELTILHTAKCTMYCQVLYAFHAKLRIC